METAIKLTAPFKSMITKRLLHTFEQKMGSNCSRRELDDLMIPVGGRIMGRREHRVCMLEFLKLNMYHNSERRTMNLARKPDNYSLQLLGCGGQMDSHSM